MAIFKVFSPKQPIFEEDQPFRAMGLKPGHIRLINFKLKEISKGYKINFIMLHSWYGGILLKNEVSAEDELRAKELRIDLPESITKEIVETVIDNMVKQLKK